MISVDGILLQNKPLSNVEIQDAVSRSMYLDFEAFSFKIIYRANLGETSAVL